MGKELAAVEFQPRWNAYLCTSCYLCFVTVDVDDGVTPMFLSCRHCSGRMQSAMYASVNTWPRKLHNRPADGVWYKPKRMERRRMKREFPAMFQHVSKGGLILRPPKKGDPDPPKVPSASLLD